jgi:AraC-like DNA-binding protein
VTEVSLNNLRLWTTTERLSRIAFVAVPGGMMLLSFPIGQARAPICGGIAVPPGNLIAHGPGELFHARTEGSAQWGAILVSLDLLNTYGRAVFGTDFSPPAPVRLWRPLASPRRALCTLHLAAIRTAVARPALLDENAAHGLEQQLIEAIIGCISSGETWIESRTKRRGREVMVRFEDLIDSGWTAAKSMPELCATLQISDRHLRYLCANHLGMSPSSYDRVRRLYRARRALRGADPASDSVSAIARQHGFVNAGRFAVRYQKAFDESPSATLRRGSAPVVTMPKGRPMASDATSRKR